MWTNTPKELMEYYDYTFDAHFKKATPSFLPRKDILDYMIARNSVDGALDSVKYNHTVESVTFNPDIEKFIVKVTDNISGTTSDAEFDKCIWAAGGNGVAEKPDDIMELLKDFTGKVMHSMDATEGFESDVKGKNVLIVGESCSAEDLALRAVKLGANHVYVCGRDGEGAAESTKTWPEDKVTVIFGPPHKIMKGNIFKCQAVYWSEKRQRYRRDLDEPPVKVKDIGTVILCTGYDSNYKFLDESLMYDNEGEWTVTKGWKMINNALCASIGSPKPSKVLYVGNTCYPDVYRGLLISNPNMMFIHETEDGVSPIFELDVLANLILGYLTGVVDIPCEKDMLKANQKQLEAEMQVPWLRVNMDPAYIEEIDELPDEHWMNNADDERSIELNKMYAEFLVKKIARDMMDAKYPVDFGDMKKLTALGAKFAGISIASERCRSSLQKDRDASWKTFRDNIQTEFASIFTNTSSCPLKGHWLDLKTETRHPTLAEFE